MLGKQLDRNGCEMMKKTVQGTWALKGSFITFFEDGSWVEATHMSGKLFAMLEGIWNLEGKELSLATSSREFWIPAVGY